MKENNMTISRALEHEHGRPTWTWPTWTRWPSAEEEEALVEEAGPETETKTEPQPETCAAIDIRRIARIVVNQGPQPRPTLPEKCTKAVHHTLKSNFKYNYSIQIF